MPEKRKIVSGNIVDVLNSKIFPGTIEIKGSRINKILPAQRKYQNYIIPGFIDSHVHIESSMLAPSEFARAAAVQGTVAVVSDCHEIANVLGIEGVEYMIENTKRAPVKFYFSAPSSVPATAFETSGASLGAAEIASLLKKDEIKYLGEMMNIPGVLQGEPAVMEKIQIAKRYAKPIDGHAPGLRGQDLQKYAQAGISTDHESIGYQEALEKIKLGMKIQIRQGSAAKNFAQLVPLLKEHSQDCMFCSDDKSAGDLINGHINTLAKSALKQGIGLMKVLRSACLNPVLHYKLDVGLLREGDEADFLGIDNLEDFNVLKTYLRGEVVAENGRPLVGPEPADLVNNFSIKEKEPVDFAFPFSQASKESLRLPAGQGQTDIIEAIDGQLITNRLRAAPKTAGRYFVSDVARDILKIAVVNRYKTTKPAMAFVKNFGLKRGAIASSIAHDSHNIVAVGVEDKDLCRAVNLVIGHKGGIAAVSAKKEMILPLPLAGIMSNQDYVKVAEQSAALNKMARQLGSNLRSPFMTLSFMSLLVIPKIKLSDKGLFFY